MNTAEGKPPARRDPFEDPAALARIAPGAPTPPPLRLAPGGAGSGPAARTGAKAPVAAADAPGGPGRGVAAPRPSDALTEASAAPPGPPPSVRGRWRAAGLMGPRTERLRFDTYEPDTPHQKHAFSVCRAFAACYPDGPRALQLYGPWGVGKTHLAVATLAEILARVSVPAAVVNLREAFDELVDARGGASGKPVKAIMERYTLPRVLLIDDWGTEKGTLPDWTHTKFTELVNAWYMQDATLIVTSNLKPDEWEARYDGIILSRLAEMRQGPPLLVNGEDRRRRTTDKYEAMMRLSREMGEGL